MKVAICYDWANRIGGAERILVAITKLWPGSDLFTTVYDPNKAPWTKNFASVKTTFLQKIPLAKKYPRFLYPLMSVGFEQFNFDGYDLVISVSSGPAKSIITKPETCHICYCLTPPRYLWQKKFLFNKNFLFPFLVKLKSFDFSFAQRPDFILTISENVAKKIKQFYQRNSKVIYPGVDLTKFKPALKPGKGSYFLIVSRLVEYKKIDLVIKVFNRLGRKLKIVGTGREEVRLKRLARKNIEFLGLINDRKLVREYQNCRALIAPQEEDFGLTPIEAQACGRPVIGFKAGGNLETIIPGKTGEFFSPQTETELIQILEDFDPKKYSKADCQANAARFSLEKFSIGFKKAVEKNFKNYSQKNSLSFLLRPSIALSEHSE